MYPLFESIRCYNGRIYNIAAHNFRANKARKEVLGNSNKLNLRSHIHVPDSCKKGLYKCRVSYGQEVGKIVFTPYFPKVIKTLKMIDVKFDYAHKWEDRNQINTTFTKKGSADDVLFIKDGKITDTSYSNIALFDGMKWYTPQSPMLLGTMRAKLIQQQKIIPRILHVKDLQKFKKIALFNAMNTFGEIVFSTKNIF